MLSQKPSSLDLSRRAFGIARVAARVVLFVLTVAGALAGAAQNYGNGRALPPEVTQELQRRGIAEETLRTRLHELGIDVERLTDEQLLLLRPEIEAVVDELTEEAAESLDAARPRTPARNSAADPIYRDRYGRSRDTLRRPDTLDDRRGNGSQPINRDVDRDRGRPVDRTSGRTGADRRLGRRSGRAGELSARDSLSPRDEVAQLDSVPPIYGHEIFRNGALEIFGANGGRDLPDSYRVGVGDQLAISIFGDSQQDFLLRVDETGFVSPPRIAKVYVRGLALAQVREVLIGRLRRSFLFGPGEFALSVNGSRTLRVNVFGEVDRSGTYALGAINGALNALVAAGGPSERASVRRIQRSRGRETVDIDVYAYLTDPGSIEEALALQDGDVLFVPIARKVVELRGAVRRPTRYELIDDEGLAALLEFAGGLRSDALPEAIKVRRVVNGVLTTLDAAAGRNDADYVLRDGDIVEVRSVVLPAANSIVVRGAVDLEGDFGYRPDISLSEIVRQSRLRANARTDVAFIRRTNADSTLTILQVSLDEALRGGDADVVLMQNDTLEILALNTYADASYISVTGAVRRPVRRFPYSQDSTLTVAGALLLAGGLTPNAAEEGVIFRREAANRKVTRYQMVDLHDAASIVRLNPFDSLIVFPRELFTDTFQVEIKGAVRRPGKYTYDPSLGVRQLFTLAGGFRQEAALNRIEVFRLVFGEDQSTDTRLGTVTMNPDFEVVSGDIDLSVLRPYDVIAVRAAPEYEITKQVSVDGEVTFPGSYPLNDNIRTVGQLLRAAGGITSEAFPAGATLYRKDGNVGYVILELEEIVRSPTSPNNIVLLEGDELFVPKARELVSITTRGTRARQSYADSLLAGGEVVIAYQGERSAKWYIEEFAGGFDKRAAKATVTVRGPSGRFERTRSVLGIRDYPTVRPGSSIAIELKPIKVPRRRDQRLDWAGIAGAVTTALAAGLSIVLIIQNLRPPTNRADASFGESTTMQGVIARIQVLLGKATVGFRNRQIAKGAAGVLVNRGVSIAVNLISVPILYAYLGAEVFGVLTALLAIGIAVGFGDLGLGNGLQNYLAEVHEDLPRVASAVKTALVYAILIGALLCVVGFAVTAQLDLRTLFGTDAVGAETLAAMTRTLIVLIAIQIPLSLGQRILAAYQRLHLHSAYMTAGSVAGLALVLYGVHAEASPVYLLAALVGPNVLAHGAALAHVSYRLSLPVRAAALDLSGALAGRILLTGAFFFLVQAAFTAHATTDSLFVANRLGAGVLAEYSLVMRVIAVLVLPISALVAPLLGGLNDALAQRDYEWLGRGLRRVTWVAILNSVLVVSVLLIALRFVLELWIGQPFDISSPLLLSYAAALTFQCFSIPISVLAMTSPVLRRAALIYCLAVAVAIAVKWVALDIGGLVYFNFAGASTMLLLYVVPCAYVCYRRLYAAKEPLLDDNLRLP